MIITENDLRLIEGVFADLLKLDYSSLNRFLGSLTIMEMANLYRRLSYREYMELHHINSIEDMTDDDFIQAEIEKGE